MTELHEITSFIDELTVIADEIRYETNTKESEEVLVELRLAINKINLAIVHLENAVGDDNGY